MMTDQQRNERDRDIQRHRMRMPPSYVPVGEIMLLLAKEREGTWRLSQWIRNLNALHSCSSTRARQSESTVMFNLQELVNRKRERVWEERETSCLVVIISGSQIATGSQEQG
jgi:hypothetical protein